MNVLITGGAGFLGRGILRRIERAGWDWRVTVYSRDETKQDLCRRRYPNARYLLGDVCDTPRLTAAMTGHDVVIHAAAVKYIPDAEMNPAECVRVNVDGARSVVAAAVRAEVPTVVGISTDKAVRPVNAYGMSKALLERLFAEASAFRGATRFQMVRYGNVVGSTGSVIPLFTDQLRRDGFVTVTDPAMTRFWMSVDEAVGAIVYALDPRRVPGSIVIPQPRAMRLGDLAAALAGEAVKIVGVRPGEKVHEELLHETEPVRVVGVAHDYYEVVGRPFLAPGLHSEAPFTLASDAPEGGWLPAAELRAMIQDAADV